MSENGGDRLRAQTCERTWAATAAPVSENGGDRLRAQTCERTWAATAAPVSENGGDRLRAQTCDSRRIRADDTGNGTSRRAPPGRPPAAAPLRLLAL